MSNNFFTKNGHALKGFVQENLDILSQNLAPVEQITSLSYETSTIIPDEKVSFFQKLKNAQEYVLGLASRRLTPKFALSWGFASVAIVGALTTVSLYSPVKHTQASEDKYYIYASTPLTIEGSSYQVLAKDSRSQKINEIFKAYSCPLEGLGEVFVQEADKNNIPWWLVAAVSFQESSCGKKSPKVDGQETYNAWGWAVYGDNVHSFDNWARGVEIVSKYMGDKFYNKGVTDVCEIMKTYTPPSNGSWCNGVNYFSEMIQNYQTPSNN